MKPPRSRRSKGTSRRRLATLLLLSLVAWSWSLRDGHPAVAEVVLVGDSLAQETAPYLQRQMGSTVLLAQYFGGTAPCDWLGKDLQGGRSRVVVLSFNGNSLTPCMADTSGGQLRGEALIDKYRADVTALVDRIRSTGARVVLVGQPQRGDRGDGIDGNLEIAGINAIYMELAETEGVFFVDAGAAVETDDGAFARTLPCLPGEAECGDAGDNAVRHDDGVHLCPGTSDLPCNVYSSGAYRFAEAIADAISRL